MAGAWLTSDGSSRYPAPGHHNLREKLNASAVARAAGIDSTATISAVFSRTPYTFFTPRPEVPLTMLRGSELVTLNLQ